MTSDRTKFLYFEKFDGGSVKFSSEEVAPIFGR